MHFLQYRALSLKKTSWKQRETHQGMKGMVLKMLSRKQIKKRMRRARKAAKPQ